MKLKNFIFVSKFGESLKKLTLMSLKKSDAFALAKFVKEFNENSIIFNTEREKIIRKYGTIDGDKFEVRPEDSDKFTTEFMELLNLELDYVNISITLPEDSFLSTADVMELGSIVK